MIKTKLLSSINNFTNLLDTNGYERKEGIYTIPEEWSDTQPERYNRVVKELDNEVDSLLEYYNHLIINGKKKLRI